MISLVVVVLLFIGNATTDRRYLETYSFTTGTFANEPVNISVPILGGGSTINPLAPDSMHSFVKLVTGVLYTGPRWATEGARLIARARRLANLDVSGCAPVLELLAQQEGVVPFEQLAEVIPKGSNVLAILCQVQDLDGVRAVRGEPSGLMLLSELRSELRAAVPIRRKKKKARPHQNEMPEP